MKVRCFVLVFLASFGLRPAMAAIREPPSQAGAVRVLAEAKAEQPSPAARGLLATAPTVAPPLIAEPRDDGLRRELAERGSVISARFDALDAKIYEIVGRLQLLAMCLIAMFLGLAVWQVSITRQIAQLRARQIQQSGGLR
jgi:hypothetical protein